MHARLGVDSVNVRRSVSEWGFSSWWNNTFCRASTNTSIWFRVIHPKKKNNTPYIHCYNHTTLCGCALNSKSKTMHEEKRWKLWQVSETVLVFPLSSLVFPLLYFFRRTWDSANNCCQQTKQTNYTVSPHCNIAVMDDDVPWKHCKKYSRLVCAVLANYF